MNMLKYELRECGIRIKFDEITEEKLTKALSDLLNNSKYTKNAQKLSRRFRDRPMTPQESVVFWTEYVARHDGAEFLRAAGNDMNFIQFHLIDVYCVLLSILIIFLALLRKAIKFSYHAVANNEKLKVKKNK
jgi:glucuronosyltransferase